MHRSLATHLATIAITLSMIAELAPAQTPDPYGAVRNQMVDENLAREGIRSERVLQAMRTVPRHQFVKPEHRRSAYFDQALDIGHRQTISPPFIVAYMTEVIDPQPTDKVLEIGTGSGYQAAVLAELGAQVYTIEIVEPLGETASALLVRLGYDRVKTRVGDGYLGWPEEAPFQKIIVTCSPEKVPQPLIDQLAEGGKLVIPLGERYQQVLYLFEKRNGELVESKLLPTLFVPMTGASEDKRATLPDPKNPVIVNGGFEISTLESGKADGWHYQRRSELIEQDAPEGMRYLRFENHDPGRPAHVLQGLAVDGRSISQLRFSLRVRLTDLRVGTESYEVPSLLVHFYDHRRKHLGAQQLPAWSRDVPVWTNINGRISVPRNAQEAIVQIGLNGATGVLQIDDVRMQPVPR